MKNTMGHKGYTGSVEYSDEDGIFFGKVQFIRALISYEGGNAELVDYQDYSPISFVGKRLNGFPHPSPPPVGEGASVERLVV